MCLSWVTFCRTNLLETGNNCKGKISVFVILYKRWATLLNQILRDQVELSIVVIHVTKIASLFVVFSLPLMVLGEA